MAEQVEFKWVVDESDVIRAAENLTKAIDESVQASGKLENNLQGTFDSVSDGMKQAEQQTAKFSKSVGDNAKASAQAAQSNKRLRDSIADTVKEIRIGGKSIGEWVDGLKSTQDNLRGMTTGLTGTNKALRLFKIALASTGIGLILVAIGSLVAFLTRTQKGIDLVNRALAGFTAVANVFIDRLAAIGEALTTDFIGTLKSAGSELGRFIVNLQTFNLKGLREQFNGVKDAASGLAEEIRNEAAAAVELERRSQSLRDSQRALNVEFAQSRARIEELRLVADSETKSTRERQAALKEAIRLENEFGARRQQLAEENLAILRERNALGNSLTADLEAEAEAEIALAEIREDVAGRQAQDLQALQQLRREEAARIAELRAEYQRFLDDLETRSLAARIGQLTGFDRLQAEKEQALAEIEAFRTQVIAAATRAGAQLPETFQRDVQELIAAVESEFKKEVDALRQGGGIIEPINLLGGNQRDFEQAGRDAIKGLQIGVEKAQPALQRIKESLLVAFNIDDQDLQIIGQQFGDIFTNFTTGLDFATQAQIEQQDAVLAAIENRINETQALLDQELERQRQGYANNVDALKARLDEENAARQEAENKRLELERKAARQRLIANQAEQISNYILSVTRLAATESLKGLPGIFTAIAGVSLLFSLIQQARAQARRFEVPQFAEGTEYVQGPGTAKSDSVPAMLSRGERILPAALNMAVGGRHVSNEELVRLFKLGKAFESTQTKAPAYNYDLGPLLERLLSGQRETQRLEAALSYTAMKEAYTEAAERSAEKMIEYWQTRPVEKMAPDGSKMLEWKEGEAVRRQVVKK